MPRSLRAYILDPRTRVWWLAAFVLVSVVAVVVAVQPAERAPSGTGWDKFDHALAFAALGTVGVFGLSGWRHGVAWVLPILVGLGAAIEWLQSFVPSRQADWNDLLADAIGAAIGTLIGWWLTRKLERRAPGSRR
jgi:VanZ family protein